MEDCPEPCELNDLKCYEKLEEYENELERNFAYMCFNLKYAQCRTRIDYDLGITVVSVIKQASYILKQLGEWLIDCGIQVKYIRKDHQLLFPDHVDGTMAIRSLVVFDRLDRRFDLWRCIHDREIPRWMFDQYYEDWCCSP